MSRLTQLRQRIKTVATIQKTTHAMRLTSMSTHSRLQKKKAFLHAYKSAIETILKDLGLEPQTEKETITGKHLIIIVGSQKGLCGVFNTRLMHLFEKHYPLKTDNKTYELITIGTKIREYLEQRKIEAHASYDNFHANNFVDVAHELTNRIMGDSYKQVTLYSNNPRTFFLQESETHILNVPHKRELNTFELTLHLEQSPSDIIFHAETMYMKAYIEDLLFKSLIAEQAARFVSMDSSTRNAESLMTEMKRNYNKLRQASITRELTDLAGGVL